MVAARRLVALAFFGVFFVVLVRADIVIGSPRADVVAELGKPSSSARRGTRELLLFPKNVRIELDAEVVVDIKGYSPTSAPAEPAPSQPAPAAPAAQAAPAASEKKAADAEDSFNPAVAANALGDEVAKWDTAWGPRPEATVKHTPELLEIALGLALHFGFTVLALRIAFKYWEMDAFWTGTLAIAALDTAQHGILEALGPVTGGLTTMSGIQNSLPGVVMIFTIRHFCFNKRIQNAVLTASAVKVVVLLLNLFLSVALLNAAFG